MKAKPGVWLYYAEFRDLESQAVVTTICRVDTALPMR
jgi:hypothetical protein